jgi:uncharacterized protein
MNIQPNQKEPQQITSFDDKIIAIDEKEYSNSIIITNHLIRPWAPKHIDQLKSQDFEELIAAKPEVILLGTGKHFHRPTQRLLAAVYNAQIGIEWMDTRAACRSYNILLGDCRKVATALIIEKNHD